MKRKLSIIIVITLIFSIINQGNPFIQNIYGANETVTWVKNDTLDVGLDIVSNKAGDDDILLRMDLIDTGTYTLEYFLEDGRRTTVTFIQKFDQVDIQYKIDEADVLPATHNITQELVDLSYLEMNYSLEIPTWEYIEDKTVGTDMYGDDALIFNIKKSAGIRYPGVAFEINNKRVIIRWDFQTNRVYYLLTGYTGGKIVPVSFTNPSLGVTDLNILKGLEAFDVQPTHIVPDTAIANKDMGLLEYPDGDKPGSVPGLELTFKQPKTLDTDDWFFKYTETDLTGLTAIIDFEDIATNDYLDFNFELNNATDTGDKTILDIPLAGNVNPEVVYSYNNFEYKISIVKDKTDLANPENYIQWSNLNSSSIYDVGLGIQVEADPPTYDTYQFNSYLPINKFAYTYMEYALRRANMTEAYLDITPYNVGTEDEIEYEILYSKVKKDPLDPESDLWVQHFHDGTTTDGVNIFIPVPFNKESSQDVYQIIVNFAGTDMASQVLNYIAENDNNVPPTTPKIDYISNLFVIPSDEDGIDLAKVQFDMAWKAPDNKTTGELDTIFANADLNSDNDHIFYELMINEVPEDTTDNPFQVIKVIELYLDVNDEIKMRYHTGVPEPNTPTPSDALNFIDGYNVIDQTFRMDKLVICEEGQRVHILDTNADDVNNEYTVTDSGESYDFEYPGVNYLRIRAITEIDDMIGISYNSIPISLSLSLLEYKIPIVEGMSYSPIYGTVQDDPVGITAEWHTVAEDAYGVHMLQPLGKSITNVNYDVYISQDQSALLGINPTTAVYDTLAFDSINEILLDPLDSDDLADLEDLRNGDVKVFTVTTEPSVNLALAVNLLGLDQNTNYYLRVITRLSIIDQSSVTTYKSSDPSNILSTTTPIIPTDPNEGEVKPLSVENLVADFADENFISAALSWDFPDEITFAEDQYGFEIMSLEGSTLPSTLSSRELRLEEVYSDPLLVSTNKEIWRLTVEEGQLILVKYDDTLDIWVPAAPGTAMVTNQHVEMLDNVNTPNKVYYYYVRTINTFEGAVNASSSWVYDSLTTSPVQAPVNLTAVYDSGYTMNEKTQSIIRFDAPIPPNADLTNDYIMEIYVKGEGDADYTMTTYPYTYLGQGVGSSGYTRMYYRIENLKPGSAYSIKVRIEDRTKEQDELPDGTLSYSRSPFSPRIIIRTEFDQAEYEKEFIYNKYLEDYDRKASLLVQQDYFILNVKNNEAIVKYRDDYGSGSLVQSRNDYYELLVSNLSNNQKTYTYYLPASFFKTANTNNATVSISPNNHEIDIRPYSISETLTPAIKEVLAEIKTYNTTNVDYYVKLVVTVGLYNNQVNLKTTASDVVSVKLSVYVSNMKEFNIDELMVESLTSLIDSHRNDLKLKLMTELEKGINESNLLKIVQDEIVLVQTEHYTAAGLIMSNHLSKDFRTITQTAKNLYIQLATYNQPIDQEGYYKKSGIWEKIATTFYANNYFIQSKDLTSYILATRDSNSATLGNFYSLESIGIINKYDLTEIFTVAELSNLSLPIQRYQVVSSYARLLNATVGYDDSNFLKNKGITVTSGNLYTSIKNEELLYLYTQVFASRHGINLSSVQIHDYNMIEDSSLINSAYRTTILKGANLGIFQLNSGRVLPTQVTTMKQLIELLTRIEKGLY
ncbi:MAG: hypothetical protein PF505_00960 [Vallitaleaceae bacterium]|nr:hypothetical protein [Vallitaleaceae bacterium]